MCIAILFISISASPSSSSSRENHCTARRSAVLLCTCLPLRDRSCPLPQLRPARAALAVSRYCAAWAFSLREPGVTFIAALFIIVAILVVAVCQALLLQLPGVAIIVAMEVDVSFVSLLLVLGLLLLPIDTSMAVPSLFQQASGKVYLSLYVS